MQTDVVIRNWNVVRPESVFPADILVQGGRIAGIPSSNSESKTHRSIDTELLNPVSNYTPFDGNLVEGWPVSRGLRTCRE